MNQFSESAERVTAAAKALEVSNTTIYRYLEKLPELNTEN